MRHFTKIGSEFADLGFFLRYTFLGFADFAIELVLGVDCLDVVLTELICAFLETLEHVDDLFNALALLVDALGARSSWGHCRDDESHDNRDGEHIQESFHRQVQSLANITNTLRKSDETLSDARHVPDCGWNASVSSIPTRSCREASK